MATLELFQIRHSPNSMKARIALGFKGVEYEAINVDPRDRSTLLEISGQPLTPVMRHEGRVLFDSASILRYLEANFRDRDALYRSDRESMRAIERWEWFARRELSEPTVKIFRMLLRGGGEDLAQAACQQLQELTERIEEQLQEGPWLMGEALSAADVINAPFVFLGSIPAEQAKGRVWEFFHQHLQLGEDRQRTRDWCRRVLAFDGGLD